MNKIKIAVVGVGLIGKRHIECIQADSNCELSAIVDPEPSVELTASKEGVCYYKKQEELLEKDCLDGMIPETPNQLHVKQALKGIEAGMAIICGNAIAHTLEEGERLCKAAIAAKARIFVR